MSIPWRQVGRWLPRVRSRGADLALRALESLNAQGLSFTEVRG